MAASASSKKGMRCCQGLDPSLRHNQFLCILCSKRKSLQPVERGDGEGRGQGRGYLQQRSRDSVTGELRYQQSRAMCGHRLGVCASGHEGRGSAGVTEASLVPRGDTAVVSRLDFRGTGEDPCCGDEEEPVRSRLAKACPVPASGCAPRVCFKRCVARRWASSRSARLPDPSGSRPAVSRVPR